MYVNEYFTSKYSSLLNLFAAAAAKSLQSCLILFDPVDCSPSGSSVHAILQARILEWATISYSRGSSLLKNGTQVSYISCIGRQVLYD